MGKRPIAAGKSSYDLIDTTEFFRAIDLREGMSVLDVACGKGNYAFDMARTIGEKGLVYAVDLWEEGITSLKLRAASHDLFNIEAIVCDVSQKIPVKDNRADLCLMATVLHDLISDNTEKGTLGEVLRILKPGGTLAVVEFKKIPGPPGPPEKIRLSPEDLEEILAPFGLKCADTIDLGSFTYLSMFTC